MAFLTGPASPLSTVIAQQVRSQRAEPFDAPGVVVIEDPRVAVVRQIMRLLERLIKILDHMNRPHRHVEDDFMKGWGEPGGTLD